MGYVGADGESSYLTTKRTKRSRLAQYWLRPAGLPEKDAAELLPQITFANTGVSVWRNLAATFSCTFFLWFVSVLLIGLASSVANSHSDGIIDYSNCLAFVSILAPIIWLSWATQATFTLPRNALRQINTDAVTTEEIEAFLPKVRGELDKTYINTVLETIRQPIPTVACPDIRSALRAIGDTVSLLPGEPLAQGATDVVALRAQATQKRIQANGESDSLLQASLRRQAEADETQASILEHSGMAGKRLRARHDETLSQLHTLRSVLTVYGSPETAARLEQGDLLQESVRRVTVEAVATADAKRELDDSELMTLYGKSLPEAQTQTVGGYGPQPQSQSKWWQGANGNSSPTN